MLHQSTYKPGTNERLNALSLQNITRSQLRGYFSRAWSLYEMMFSAIKDPETYYIAPDPLRHPLIFYLGHTAAFYVNKLILAGIIEKGINPRFEILFAKGVDPGSADQLDSDLGWPRLPEVLAYRGEVYKLVTSVIDTVDIPERIGFDDPLWNLLMGIEHDLIHFETSSVLIRQLNVNMVEAPAGWKYAPTFGFSPEYELIKVAGGTVKLGKDWSDDLYGWDNEYGKLETEVKPFRASRHMITNGEFVHFVKQGGYDNRTYWSDEAWQWKTQTNTQMPKFWLNDGGKFRYRAMFDIIDMPLDWPVEVNAYEARAFCAFKGEGYRLLSEAEFKLLTERQFRRTEPALSEGFNLNFKFGSPTPVGYVEEDDVLFKDLYGNVWDWLADSFYPLPGFRVHEDYRDFSEPYFDDDHKMLLGGSWITCGSGASQYYRLWFRDYFFQHAGFRLAMDA